MYVKRQKENEVRIVREEKSTVTRRGRSEIEETGRLAKREMQREKTGRKGERRSNLRIFYNDFPAQ